MIHTWRSSLRDAGSQAHSVPQRFLAASEVWVFLNLALALLISIPAINLFTHGTHITVAHAMGSTIGINTMILFASVFFMGGRLGQVAQRRSIQGFVLLNVSLLTFWACLIGAGLMKGWMTVTTDLSFQEIMDRARPFIAGFALAGLGLFAGLSMLAWQAVRALLLTMSRTDRPRGPGGSAAQVMAGKLEYQGTR
jgi:nitric oxide reductase subunit B